jgi:hypothetical protein
MPVKAVSRKLRKVKRLGRGRIPADILDAIETEVSAAVAHRLGNSVA